MSDIRGAMILFVLAGTLASCGGSDSPSAQKKILKGFSLADFHRLRAEKTMSLTPTQSDAVEAVFSLKGAELLNSKGQANPHGNWVEARSGLRDLAVKLYDIMQDARSTSNSSILESDEPLDDHFVCLFNSPNSSLVGERSVVGKNQVSYTKKATPAADNPNSIQEDVVVENRAEGAYDSRNCRIEKSEAEYALYPWPNYPSGEGVRKEKKPSSSGLPEVTSENDLLDFLKDPETEPLPLLPPDVPASHEAEKIDEDSNQVSSSDLQKLYEAEVEMRKQAVRQNYDKLTNKVDGKLTFESELSVRASAKRELRALDTNHEDSRAKKAESLLNGVKLQADAFLRFNGSVTSTGFDREKKIWEEHKFEVKNLGILIQLNEATAKKSASVGRNDLVSSDENKAEERDFWRDQMLCAGSVIMDGKPIDCEEFVNALLDERFHN
jgi:hypothetical protein